MGKLIQKLQHARGSGQRAIEDSLIARETAAEALDALLARLGDTELTALVLLVAGGFNVTDTATACKRSKALIYDKVACITRKRELLSQGADVQTGSVPEWSDVQADNDDDLAASALHDPTDAELIADGEALRSVLRCGHCQRYKPRAEFAPKRGHPGQLSARCAECLEREKLRKRKLKEKIA